MTFSFISTTVAFQRPFSNQTTFTLSGGELNQAWAPELILTLATHWLLGNICYRSKLSGYQVAKKAVKHRVPQQVCVHLY